MTSSDKTVTDPGMGDPMTAYIARTARVSGQAQVRDRAQVYGRAQVRDRAQVIDLAQVYGRAGVYGQGDIASARHYFTVGPVGSEDRTVTVHRHYDGPGSTVWGHLVVAGCWSGRLDALAARIAADRTHGWRGDVSRWRADYEALIAFARPRVAEWEAEPLTDADHARWAEVIEMGDAAVDRGRMVPLESQTGACCYGPQP